MNLNARALLAIGIVTILFAGSLPASADGGPPETIGKFVRLGMTDDLTEDSVTTTPSGVEVDAPAFSSSLKVDLGWVQDKVGDFSTDVEFHIDGQGRVVLPGQDTEFRKLEIGNQPVFTLGSKDSIRFQERPMWLSVEDMGENTYRLEMDDGDTSGQTVYVSKKWLFAHGIHRPDAIHEDGSNLTVTLSEDGQGYLIGVPHFSEIVLTQSDLRVMGKRNGEFVTHLGLRYWDSASRTLRVDVTPQLFDYQVWLEQDWFNVNLTDAALHGRSWTNGTHQGEAYRVVPVPKAETPTTLVFSPFVVPMADVFTAGSNETFELTYPVRLSAATSTAGLNVTLLDGPATFYFTGNSSWLTDLGVVHPNIHSSEGKVNVWTMLGSNEIQIPIQGAFWFALEESATTAAQIKFITDITSFALGDKCRAAVGPVLQEVDRWENGDSKGGLFVAGSTFCFEWNLWHPNADHYNVAAAISNSNGEAMCGSGQESSAADGSEVTRVGYRICEWPEDVPFPINAIQWDFVAAAYWVVDNTNGVDVLSGLSCAGGVFVAAVTVPATFGTSLVWLVGAAATGLGCYSFAQSAGNALINKGKTIGRELLGGAGDGRVIGELELWLYDPDNKRVDTWTDLEWNPLLFPSRPPGFDGFQRIWWMVRDVQAAELVYATDISVVRGMTYNNNEMTMTWGPGGATGLAVLPNFSGSAGGHPNTNEITTIQGGNTLDWEALEPQCVFLRDINLMIEDSQYEVIVGTPMDIPDAFCGVGIVPALLVENNQDANGQTIPDAPWLTFAIDGHNLPPGMMVASHGSLSLNDVIAAGGNIPGAIILAITGNQTWAEGVTSVEIPVDGYHEEGQGLPPCSLEELPYSVLFEVETTGVSTAGGYNQYDWDERWVTICFDPLLDLVVQLEAN